jgi:hypothetical protein
MKAFATRARPERKPIAVLAELGAGLFVAGREKGAVFIGLDGTASSLSVTLEEVLARNNRRTAIYEGDSVTLEF